MKQFFQQFCKNPKQVGSVIPSSWIFINNFLSKIDFSQDLSIVEFGAWNWNFTKKILDNMTDSSNLISFEINKELYYYVKDLIQDKRLKLINDWAENLYKYIWNKKLDIIFSELPLASLPRDLIEQILDTTYESLKDWWIYMQYQYFLSNRWDIKKVFGKHKLYFELINFPPAFYYKCTKI